MAPFETVAFAKMITLALVFSYALGSHGQDTMSNSLLDKHAQIVAGSRITKPLFAKEISNIWLFSDTVPYILNVTSPKTFDADILNCTQYNSPSDAFNFCVQFKLSVVDYLDVINEKIVNPRLEVYSDQAIEDEPELRKRNPWHLVQDLIGGVNSIFTGFPTRRKFLATLKRINQIEATALLNRNNTQILHEQLDFLEKDFSLTKSQFTHDLKVLAQDEQLLHQVSYILLSLTKHQFEFHRYYNFISACDGGYISRVVISPYQLWSSMGLLDSKLRKQGYTLSIPTVSVEAYFAEKLAHCKDYEESTLVYISVPIINKRTHVYPVELVPIPTQLGANEVCTLANMPKYVAYYGEYNSVWPLSYKFGDSLYQVGQDFSVNNPLSLRIRRCIHAVMQATNLTAMRMLCDWECQSVQEKFESVIALSDQQFIITTYKPSITVTCTNSALDKVVKKPFQIGSFFLSLTCECEVKLDSLVVSASGSCMGIEEATAIHVIDHAFTSLPSLPHTDFEKGDLADIISRKYAPIVFNETFDEYKNLYGNPITKLFKDKSSSFVYYMLLGLGFVVFLAGLTYVVYTLYTKVGKLTSQYLILQSTFEMARANPITSTLTTTVDDTIDVIVLLAVLFMVGLLIYWIRRANPVYTLLSKVRPASLLQGLRATTHLPRA